MDALATSGAVTRVTSLLACLYIAGVTSQYRRAQSVNLPYMHILMIYSGDIVAADHIASTHIAL